MNTEFTESWLRYFFKFAILASERSTCLRRKVGAVLVRDRRIISTGYNGAPRGVTSCYDLGSCLRDKMGIPSGYRHEYCRAVGAHAEANSITQCALHGVSCKDAIMFCTTAPCGICVATAINAGIKTIYHLEGYYNPTIDLLSEDGDVDIEIIKIDPESLGLSYQGSAEQGGSV